MLAHALIKFLLLLPLANSKLIEVARQENAEEAQAPAWDYHNTNWGGNYSMCNGNRQSPINLTNSFTLFTPLRPIYFGYYDVQLQPDLVVFNNGRTVEMLVPDTINGRRPFITGGIMKSNYEAENVHFHWGSPDVKGSEHSINGRFFDVEMHIVHKNVLYRTVEEALTHRDGLAVLGVMLKIVNLAESDNRGLSQILNLLPEITEFDSRATVNGPLSLGKIIANLHTKNFFTYSGSLTTPPCSEAVIWSVFPDPLAVPFTQIQRFWNIRDENGDYLIDNFRPIQKRNRRQVYYRTTPNTNNLLNIEDVVGPKA